ncbi:energy-coupling factor transporter ATP-binding protein EcfA2 [Arthrobacter sp. JUb119]|uniref:type IV secretory system conjugative DNA transfer family protein n=1 Tax=Arthrobacter sp. JUb115 TaxID=2485108 RepID=UPI00105C101C|nr:FtsK/SpoIIIE domain-containing protein [Arthrobacter sp. JUb115]MCS3494464.1 energy-coupling factor transporter ATP-binding protein EcfA2 [Arthrobacter sp. JUb119]TDU22555.1 uncharacterized protein DUF853 [Arthrobacter sp. JUb115]
MTDFEVCKGYPLSMRNQMSSMALETPDEFALLPPRRYRFAQGMLALVIASLVGWAVAEILGYSINATLAFSLLGIVVVGASVLHGRRRRKDRIMDELVLRTYDALGAKRIDRKLIRCDKWTRSLLPKPAALLFHHNPVTWDGKPLGQTRANLVIGLALKPILQKLFPAMAIKIEPGPQPFTLVASLQDVETEQEGTSEESADTRAQLVASELFKDPMEVETTADPDGVEEVTVKHHQGTDFAMAARRNRVERIFNTRVPGHWRAHWDTVGDVVVFKQRKELPSMVKIDISSFKPILTHSQYTAFEVPIAAAENNLVVTWRPYLQSHALIVGPTGSGKTVILHNMAIACSHAGLRVWVVDGKRVEFLGFRWWPNVEFIAAKVPHQIKLIHDAKKLMDERYDLIEDGKASLDDFEPLILIIDEVASLVKRIESWWAEQGYKGKPPVKEWLSDLGRLARTAKIHLVLGLQRPDVEFLNGEMRSNFGARYSVGRLDPQGAMMMWENAAVGTTVARSKKGRGFATTLDGDVVESQFIYAPNPDPVAPGFDPAFVTAVRPSQTRWGIKHIEDVPDIQIDIDGKEQPSLLDDYLDAKIIDGPHPNWVKHEEGEGPAENADETPETVEETEILESWLPGDDSASDSEDDDASFEGFSDQTISVEPAKLEPGDLVEIDEDLELWGVVEDVLIDEVGAQIDYRAMSTGEPEMLALEPSDKVRTRKPVDPVVED